MVNLRPAAIIRWGKYEGRVAVGLDGHTTDDNLVENALYLRAKD